MFSAHWTRLSSMTLKGLPAWYQNFLELNQNTEDPVLVLIWNSELEPSAVLTSLMFNGYQFVTGYQLPFTCLLLAACCRFPLSCCIWRFLIVFPVSLFSSCWLVMCLSEPVSGFSCQSGGSVPLSGSCRVGSSLSGSCFVVGSGRQRIRRGLGSSQRGVALSGGGNVDVQDEAAADRCDRGPEGLRRFQGNRRLR